MDEGRSQRSKEFMYCLITGSGALDNIIIVPIDLVLQSLQIKKEQQSKKDQPMWEETISHVQKDIEWVHDIISLMVKTVL